MRQREIERIEKNGIWICWLYTVSKPRVRPPEKCKAFSGNKKCFWGIRKCDAVKFQLKEVKDEGEV